MLQKLKVLAMVLAIVAIPFVSLVFSPSARACTNYETNVIKSGCITADECASGKTMVQTITNKTTNSDESRTICAPLGTDSSSNNPIWTDLKTIIDALGAGVGVIVVAVIVIGGIQYTAAGDQASKVEEAKKRIANALFALVSFFLIWAFLQWIIPGGIFSPH